jgi:hypothetical protein
VRPQRRQAAQCLPPEARPVPGALPRQEVAAARPEPEAVEALRLPVVRQPQAAVHRVHLVADQ